MTGAHQRDSSSEGGSERVTDMSDVEPAPRRGMTWKGWLTIAACAAYVLSPLDLAPEALLGPLGLPDDLVAVLVAAKVGWSSRRPKQPHD